MWIVKIITNADVNTKTGLKSSIMLLILFFLKWYTDNISAAMGQLIEIIQAILYEIEININFISVVLFNIPSIWAIIKNVRIVHSYSDLEGYGIESIETKEELYDPNGDLYTGHEGDSYTLYQGEESESYTISFSWDILYPYIGLWRGCGSCAIKTIGSPNIDNYDIHMFEFVISF